jgi:hypothetical protein
MSTLESHPELVSKEGKEPSDERKGTEGRRPETHHPRKRAS